MNPTASIAAVLGLLASGAAAQESASHGVTVVVVEINSIQVLNGDVNLTLNPPPDGTPVTVTDDHCELAWRTNANRRVDITVQTSLANPRYLLTVEARNVRVLAMEPQNGRPGTPVGPVTLQGVAARPFINNIRRVFAMSDLFYSATASVADGYGTETHTVTYTLATR